MGVGTLDECFAGGRPYKGYSSRASRYGATRLALMQRTVSREEFANSSVENEISPRRAEMKLRKNEMKLRKNEMKLRRSWPFSPWRI